MSLLLHHYQGILESYMVNSPDSIRRFASWIRAVILILSHRDEYDQDDKCAKFFVQALSVVKMAAADHAGVSRNRYNDDTSNSLKAYPDVEVQWLMAQAWNRGVAIAT
jgi:hypothetical protein